MQSVVVYSLNHDTTAHLGSALPQFSKIWPPPAHVQPCKGLPICPSTAYVLGLYNILDRYSRYLRTFECDIDRTKNSSKLKELGSSLCRDFPCLFTHHNFANRLRDKINEAQANPEQKPKDPLDFIHLKNKLVIDTEELLYIKSDGHYLEFYVDGKSKPELDQAADSLPAYSGNVEAHIIADMLRIEAITTELREFKNDTKQRLNKMESWIIAIIGVTVTTLLGTIAILAQSLIK